MAGGSGKRLWPLSRQDMPKQLLRVVGGKSLLRIAYERLDGIVPAEQILVCTGADYADVVASELPEVDPVNILGEPEGRDSLNAVAWPAAVLATRDPAAVVAVVTADRSCIRAQFQGRARQGLLRGRRGRRRCAGHSESFRLATHWLRLTCIAGRPSRVIPRSAR